MPFLIVAVLVAVETSILFTYKGVAVMKKLTPLIF